MKEKFLLLLIILLAFFLRFYNLNWDSNQHLHPDERFLTMVSNKMIWPKTISQYLDPQKSLLNPYNLGENFYVYGNFPLILTKFLAIKFNKDNYNDFTILARGVSAFFDLMIVVLVYKTTKLLFKSSTFYVPRSILYFPLFSAFFYAISVYPIQSSHFFTTDTFLNFFMFGSFYFVLRFYVFNKYVLRSMFYFIFSAVFLGLALSSKISALYILPLNLAVFFLSFLKEKSGLLKKIIKYLLFTIYYLLFTYLSLRLASPYYFASSNFFDFKLNEKFISSINSLKFFTTKDAWYPPGVQWINKPWWGLLSTTFFVGLGPVNFIVMVVGTIYLISNIKYQISNINKQYKNLIIFLIVFWTVSYFVYQSLQFAKSIRYTIYLYPFFAIFGGIGIAVVSNQLNRLNQLESVISVGISWNRLKSVKSVKVKKFFLHVLRFMFYVLLLVWPTLFFTIYLHKNTRVEASEWIYKNLPNNAVILGEHWDDPLPLYVENPYMKNFQVELLPIFDPDTSEKWQKMRELLGKADYYVLSSNRGWGSIPTVPERYPIMSDFYKKLFNKECFDIKINCKFENCHPELVSGSHLKSQERFCFRKIKEFLPYYYKFIRYPDSWIEETFTVYDHQTVLIYEKIKK